MNEYFIHLGILILLYSILAQGFNVNFGVGRIFNLAHGACFAIGAYATALWSTEMYDASVLWLSEVIVPIYPSEPTRTSIAITGTYLFCLFLSIFATTLFSFFLGAISLRLATDYFAIGTLAFSSVVSALLTNWKSLTRGVLGIPGIPRPELFGLSLQENANFLLVLLGVAVIVHACLYLLFRNRFSRKLRSQAEYEAAALGLGTNTEKVRLGSFMASSAAAGVAGCFFAFYLQYIDPSSFSFSEMIFVLTITVVGCPGSFWGVIGSVVFLLLLPEGLAQIQWINDRPSILGPMRQLLYATVLFICIFLNKKRLFPKPREI